MTLSLDYHKLAPLMEQYTLILTPNARTQKAIYSGQMLNFHEHQVVESIDVRSFSQWQDHLWSELSFCQILPNKISNLAIKSWLEKLVRDEPDWTLTNPSGVATKILEAYQNLIQWELGLNDVLANETIEIDYFKIWIEKLNIFCDSKKLIPEFALLKYIKTHIDQLVKQIPTHILLVGFNQLTPLQQSFFVELKKRNIRVEKYAYKKQPKSASQIHFTSLKDELSFAANYAKNYVNEIADKSKGDGGCIGIVVENVANHLGEVHQAFSGVFQPEETKPWVALDKPKYNVSAGFSLAEQPLVKAALFLLNLKSNRLKLEELHFLKNTPFIYWGEQEANTKYFLHQLCLNPRKEYSMTFLLKSIESLENHQQLSLLAERLQKIIESNTGYASMSDHICQWQEILLSWQWIGSFENVDSQAITNNSKLNEFEVQATKFFFEIMHQCNSLNELYQSVLHKEAVDFLNMLTQQQTFQIASDRSDVHILGILEATGLQFDQLLIVGFNHVNWPQTNKINPFLPLQLQRDKYMPGSSAEREYEYAKDLSTSLLSSANQIIVTSSDIDSASSATSASFFADLHVKNISHFLDEKTNSNIEKTSDYQWIDDSTLDVSDINIAGGAYLLSNYARCPFKSMTAYQLKLSGYEEPEIGIEPKIRGTWLHETMEIIWTELGSQKKLLALNESDIEELIFDSLQKVMQKLQPYLFAVTDEEIVDLELEKLAGLIFEWMMIEKNRDDFSVESLEKRYELELGELSLNFRIDRIDVNNSNQVEIIDYKTGKTELNNWFGVRPTETQMPAYVLAMHEREKSGLNYARIKTGEVAQSGIRFKKDSSTNEVGVEIVERNTDEIKIYPYKKEKIQNIEQLMAQWQQTLTRMANGITRGYMPVSPKDKSQSCLYCDYSAFCRIDEEQPNE